MIKKDFPNDLIIVDHESLLNPYGKFINCFKIKFFWLFIKVTFFFIEGTQKCDRDYDCGKNMECLTGICYCYDGFYPENNYCTDIASIKRNSSKTSTSNLPS